MSGDPTLNAYATKVAEAEAAVKSVKDPELRRVAFEKILGHLLGGGDPKPASTDSTTKRHPAKIPEKSGTKGRAQSTKAGPKARVVELADEDFFKKQKTIADVKTELANRGYHIPLTSLSGPLQSLTRQRRLRREKVSAKGKGSKATYAYSNW